MSSETPKDTDAAAEETKSAEKATKTAKAAKATKTTKKKTTATKAAKKKAAKKSQTLRVRQVRSGIRHPHRMRRTLTALGLKHHQDEVVLPDNPSVRGMLQRVHHLVSVTPEDKNG
jgi:large subunit ribosomal protein L30